MAIVFMMNEEIARGMVCFFSSKKALLLNLQLQLQLQIQIQKITTKTTTITNLKNTNLQFTFKLIRYGWCSSTSNIFSSK
jgi:hypothetical protein